MKPNLLRDERKRRGWSQAQLAKALGITSKTVIRWELGQAIPFPYHRQKLAALFGKTIQELGLHQDTDEYDAFKQIGRPVAPSSVSAVPVQGSFLTDSAIPLHFKSANPLPRRDSLLTLIKESLFTRDTVFVTALDDLPSTGEADLAHALAMDREVQAHFCDGILWADLAFHTNVLGVLARWGKLLGVAPSQIKDLRSRQAWGQALRAALGTRQMLLVIDDAYRAQDALALRVGGSRCAHLLTTGLSQVALAFAQEGAIVVSQVEGGDRVALLQHIMPQLVEQGDSGFAKCIEEKQR